MSNQTKMVRVTARIADERLLELGKVLDEVCDQEQPGDEAGLLMCATAHAAVNLGIPAEVLLELMERLYEGAQKAQQDARKHMSKKRVH